jgi:hypothetical protein
MDILKLEPYWSESSDALRKSHELVRVLINGQDLIDLIKPIEEAYEPKIAGSYIGLYANEVFWPSQRMLGGSDYCWQGENIVGLLQCSCGEEGCWSFTAKIQINDHVVIWSDFGNNHREDWDYSALGFFSFDKNQYLNEIRAQAHT